MRRQIFTGGADTAGRRQSAGSARSWLRASSTRPFGAHKTVLVSGPGLDAAALCDASADARLATASDPVVTAAGWSFTALGA